MRVMRRILTATYGLSDNSTPICAICEPNGPMENGTTYIVRPRIAPLNNGFKVARMSSGCIQLLVGPASSLFNEQIYVRSSTRATSDGSLQARYELGRSAGLRRLSVPDCTIWAHKALYSSSEPSHQWMLAGSSSAAWARTHARSSGCWMWLGGLNGAVMGDSLS